MASLVLCGLPPAFAKQADRELVLAAKGATPATIIVSPLAQAPANLDAGGQFDKSAPYVWERRAADDLQKYMELMTGVRAPIASTPEAIETALQARGPVIVIGTEALRLDPTLQIALRQVQKANPVLRSDAIVMRRRDNRIYLAGSNDDSNYYAISQLLAKWGCRWYMPTEFGECIPEKKSLSIGRLDMAYAPPFEVRNYWLSFQGDTRGQAEFTRRNLMNVEMVPAHHAIGGYVKDIVPPGKKDFDIPYSDPKTIAQIFDKVEAQFARGENFSLSMEDGVYQSNDAAEERLKAGVYDKYYCRPSMTEPFWFLYNDLARSLHKKYPDSNSKIGFLAYSNLTIPPMRAGKAEKPLIAYLAPIDMDPNHGMDDPNSPPRQEFREIMYRWSEKMDKRVIIYDYDQRNLVWRDIPDPSHEVFAQDVQHYRKAGTLGIQTESRGAFGTIFLNLFFRGQLMWNPDANVDSLLDEFYPKFYGPAAAPMKRYWSAIYAAWEKSIATEHEYPIIPAIYTPQVVETLRRNIEAAEASVQPLQERPALTRNEKLFMERMKFTRSSFEIIKNYTSMVKAAATEGDYEAAAAFGDKGLAARKQLTAQNSIFTTTVLEAGYPYWEGEVKQYHDLKQLVNGAGGSLVSKLPLQWAFRRDANDTGLVSGFAYKPIDLSYWNTNKNRYSLTSRKDYPSTQWEMLNTGMYAQLQGVRHPDAQSFTGYMWYRTGLKLTGSQSQGKLRLMFPGLFNQAWLFINGDLVAHRPFPDLWWNTDYRFEWDVDVSQYLKPGANDIAIRLYNPHHFGGMFRRPFLYRAND